MGRYNLRQRLNLRLALTALGHRVLGRSEILSVTVRLNRECCPRPDVASSHPTEVLPSETRLRTLGEIHKCCTLLLIFASRRFYMTALEVDSYLK